MQIRSACKSPALARAMAFSVRDRASPFNKASTAAVVFLRVPMIWRQDCRSCRDGIAPARFGRPPAAFPFFQDFTGLGLGHFHGTWFRAYLDRLFEMMQFIAKLALLGATSWVVSRWFHLFGPDNFRTSAFV
jgi:hypothetical protein